MLKNVIKKASEEKIPWPWYGIKDVLNEEQVAEIRACNFSGVGKRLHGGKRSDNTSFRRYVTKESGTPALVQLVKEFRSVEVQELIWKMIYKMPGNYKGMWVRMEILNDAPGFWLEPHIDIDEKMINCLVYVNETNENKNLGTDLYQTLEGDYKHVGLVRTIPFIHNTGYIFSQFDGNGNKIHGMEKGKDIKVERRGLQINYVTFETDWPVYE